MGGGYSIILVNGAPQVTLTKYFHDFYASFSRLIENVIGASFTDLEVI